MNETNNIAPKLVVANWKMHGNLQQNAVLLNNFVKQLSTLKHTQVVVCAPYPYLPQLQQCLSNTNIAWGAQNVAKETVGAFTGEVSATMLVDFGCQFVIIGHSERATAYCESDENIAQKFVTAQKNGLTPILCVGETLIEREAGVMELVVLVSNLIPLLTCTAPRFLQTQLFRMSQFGRLVLGLAATPEQAKSMHLFIRNKVSQGSSQAANSLKILYGGSVNPQNAVQLFKVKNIDGGLIGKCSLECARFCCYLPIGRAANA